MKWSAISLVRVGCCWFIVLLILNLDLLAGTSGKISGQIRDAATRKPLPGVQITITGTAFGTITDVNGRYQLLPIPPGIYTIKLRLLGYETQVINNVTVASDQTSRLDVSLKQTMIEGESVTIRAVTPLIQKDLTFTSTTLLKNRISEIPSEEIAHLLALQPGITKDSKGALHVRGGRATEMAYLVDGVPVTDGFDRQAILEVDNSGIQELQVIAGTFNAEYGQAQSGIVNIITRKGNDHFQAELSTYMGDYLSRGKELFYHIDDLSPFAVKNIVGVFSGPIGLWDGTFFLTARREQSDGWLYGRREFALPDKHAHSQGYTIYNSHSHAGDSTFAAMNGSERNLLQGSIHFSPHKRLPFRYTFLLNLHKAGIYDQRFARFPDANSKLKNSAQSHLFHLDYILSEKSFISCNFSQLYRQKIRRLFANPYDERYLFPALSTEQIYQRNLQEGLEYIADFTDNERSQTRNTTHILKMDFTSQMHPLHLIKTGFESKWYNIDYYSAQVINDPKNKIEKLFIPFLDDENTPRCDAYTNTPQEASLYIQDKIEYHDIVVNAGLRFDYFNSHGELPSILDQKESGMLSAPRRPASIKTKWSPRTGLAFPISDRGVIHFSYGHFSQIPDFKSLYWNSEYEIQLGSLSTMVGNPDLKPETTISWEAGIQHALAADMALDAAIYFKDIKNLLGQEIIRLKGGQAYARYINRDYGNVRGFMIALEKRPVQGLAVNLDYTYQLARGNASDPFAVYTDNQGTPPRESEKQVLPLDWDQRHTLNGSFTYSLSQGRGITLVLQAGSGLPYTPTDPDRALRTAFENSARKPHSFNADLYANYSLSSRYFASAVFIKIYNLFDAKNEIDVFTDTGRAGFTHTLNYQLGNRRPDFYSAPRLVMAGLTVRLGDQKAEAP